MPDTVHPDPERRSPCIPPAVRPTGLPILFTERLTLHERDELRALRRRLLLAAQGIVDIIDTNRVDRALDGLQTIAGALDGEALRLAAQLGRNR